ncbi:pectate lyase [Stieleria varia]|uniref:Pectic acid lyase n=1 Tax=Stieleria varia TaxID=2528005 RepID=A0A5C6AFY4_9BACT|nr:pectate lyase [Stieleria varia]TWT98360.1 Pectic acid lyase [Stieleria varia]
MRIALLCPALAFLLISVRMGTAQDPSFTQQSVRQAMVSATSFMRDQIADHGGYAYVSSADGKYSNGEGIAGPDRIWVQPPGTPAVGMAMLQAYQASGDKVHLDAAIDAGNALVAGQLRSGGWGYSIEFDPSLRKKIPYRVGPHGGKDQITPTPSPGGWTVWRQGKNKANKTLIDDDTTPASIRFLAKLDQELGFKHQEIHDAALYALQSTLNAQYPIGAWGHNYDRFQPSPPSESFYPILRASYPKDWPRKWPNAWNGCYGLNDRITTNMIETMLLAADVYDDDRYRQSAIRGGDFLVNAQMPMPQPAWAQQYDENMHPVWERKFEPPAITGGESQDVIATLLKLYRETGQERFLQPIGPALKYLRNSLRKDGQLARYYELQTNRPLYFDKEYQLTSDDSNVPDHYGFIVESKLEPLDREYQRLINAGPEPKSKSLKTLAKAVAPVLAAQRSDGAWLTPTFVRDGDGKKVTPAEGVVESAVFIKNMRVLADWLAAAKRVR